MYTQGFTDYQNFSSEPYNSTAEGEYAELQTLVIDGGHANGVSSLHFDNREELLWTGLDTGQTTSFFSSAFTKYTSFQVHGHNQRVCDILSVGEGILTLAPNSVTFSQRGGIAKWTVSPSGLENGSAFHYGQQPGTTILVGGKCDKIFELDITKSGRTLRTIDSKSGGVSLGEFRTSQSNTRYLYTADHNGSIHCRDPVSLSTQHTLSCPFDSITDFDVCSNLLVTCGTSETSSANRPGGIHQVQTRFVQVYDLRMMKPAAPLQPKFDPRFLRFIPSFTTKLLICSSSGDLVIVEPSDIIPPTAQYYKMDGAGGTFTSVALSSSTQAVAFGTSTSLVHVWSSRQQPQFNQIYQETEWPNHDNTSYTQISLTDESTPFSMIPSHFPQQEENLLSEWPAELSMKKSYRPRPIDQEIINSMNVIEKIGYAPKPVNIKKCQLPYIIPNEFEDDSYDSQIEKSSEGATPRKYRPVEMTFAHLPSEDRQSEIQKYNSTKFVGLEPHIPNTYCNNMLQVLYFINPLRVALQSHCSMKETDLSAELGFLFHLLDNQEGGSAPASNFLRSFRVSPQATALRLVLTNGAGSADVARRHGNLGRLIQSWNRFILQQIHTDTSKGNQTETDESERQENRSRKSSESTSTDFNPSPDAEKASLVQRFFETRQRITTKFKSGHSSSHEASSFLFNIDWHSWTNPKNSSKDSKTTSIPFESVVKKSIWLEIYTKSWCEETQNYQMGQQTRQPLSLPDILVLNCNLDSAGNEEFWKVQTELAKSEGKESWIPHNLTLDLEGKSVEYELYATFSFIQESGNPIGNLISHVKVSKLYHEMKGMPPKDHWYLFNDLLISPVAANEAVTFDLAYSIPCVFYYVRKNFEKDHSSEVSFPLDSSVLLPTKSISKLTKELELFTPLDPDEHPKKGTLVALDCEFVTLNAEETELRSDGTNAIVRPSHSAVARVTVIRGEGDRVGKPFIDDYIATSEQIVDYLTKFSGIQPGDLDAAISSKHLATLKATYCKIRYLSHVGVKFVGHGLQNDFTELNLYVRPDQIIDTVTLFHLPRKRLVSLRFLAWFFLQKRIQEGVHDSIEDARTALELYNKYLEITSQGRKTQEFRLSTLRKLYEEGSRLDWKVPEVSSLNIKLANVHLE